MIVLDNNALVFLYRPDAEQAGLREKMQYLFDSGKEKGSIFGIPAPVLSEFLIGEHNPAARRNFLQLFGSKSRVFQILPFDMKSAVACAAVADILNERLPNQAGVESRQKIKVDRQILAIAVSNGAETIVSHDRGLLNAAKALDLDALAIDEIAVPPEAQPDLFG